jgi:nitrogenase molybdenum-iron protein alpha/beta subunit
MFTYRACSQLIIGLNSYNQIKRLIKENHFKTVALVFQTVDPEIVFSQIKKIDKMIKRCHAKSILFDTGNRHDPIKLTKDIDLIISYGSRHVHDVVKNSNNIGVPFYCINHYAGHMSACGNAMTWDGGEVSWRSSLPTVVFNSCHQLHK